MRADRQPFDPNLAVQIAAHTGHICRMCGGGCRSYDVILTEREARRLDSAWWRPLLNNVPDDVPLVRLDSASSQYTLNRVADQCVFLDSDNLCIIHKAAGVDAKPIACQIFPLHAVQAPDGLHLSLNVSCRRLVAMTDADDPLDIEQGQRLLAQTQAIVTIGQSLALTPEIEIDYEEFVERQVELLALLTSPVTNWSDVFDQWRVAAQYLLTIPGAELSPNPDGPSLFRTLSALTGHTQPIRSTLSTLYRRTEPGLRALLAGAERGILFPSSPDLQGMPPGFCAQISRQWLEGHQSALHRTARTGWVALLAALVCGTYGAIERSADGQRPDHALNEAIADAIDLFLSPAGQLALTEPNQQAFLRVGAGLAVSTAKNAGVLTPDDAEAKLRRDQVQGKSAASQVHYEAGQVVRRAIAERSGTMPENLPTVESIKELERQERKQLTAPKRKEGAQGE